MNEQLYKDKDIDKIINAALNNLGKILPKKRAILKRLLKKLGYLPVEELEVLGDEEITIVARTVRPDNPDWLRDLVETVSQVIIDKNKGKYYRRMERNRLKVLIENL